jgi:hypothetical protein
MDLDQLLQGRRPNFYVHFSRTQTQIAASLWIMPKTIMRIVR